MAGAPEGNQNAASKKPWAAAIARALQKRSVVTRVEALDELAEKLLGLCDIGDLGALKELGDRLDGKVSQDVNLGGQPNNPLVNRIELVPMMNGNSSN